MKNAISGIPSAAFDGIHTHIVLFVKKITNKNKRQSWNLDLKSTSVDKKVFEETIYLKLLSKEKRFKTTTVFPGKVTLE